MIRMKVIIPDSELSLSDMKMAKEMAIKKGIERALARGIAGNENELIARHAQNIADFGTAIEQWNTAALAVIGTAYSVFQAIAAPALANNKVAVFYKAGVETTGQPVSLLNFRQGAGGGTTYAVFDLEQLINQNGLGVEGWFSEPVVYDPSEVMNITVTARIATALLARVQLGCFIIEPKGPTISG